MQDVYIFDAVRSPRGKGSAKKGALKDTKPLDLLSQLYDALEARNPLDDKVLDSIILGCVGQVGDQGANIAKISAVYQGWSDHIQGLTVNTFCSSALTAIGLATAQIQSGMSNLVIAGGIEMLSRVPMYADKGAWFSDPEVVEKSHFTSMGVAADLIASLEGFKRTDLDAYAVQSQQRAFAAQEKGYFDRSRIPVRNKAGKIILDQEECLRPQTTQKGLSSLEPLFKDKVTESIHKKIKERYPQLSELHHFHHLGSSPAMADGASLLLIGNLNIGKGLGLIPRAKIRALDFTACEPIIMLLGGQYSMEKAVQKTGLHMSDIDLHNFAEAFSATCLKYQRDLDIDPDRFNVNGGTMTMGHAQGASGAMITTNLLDELERRDLTYGVAGISGGAGLGAGIVIENV
ncbi:MAG: acetyl-CoA C-acyltransferase [Bacteroidota bacterium]